MTTEHQQHSGGGIINHFEGATIHNIVINGNMNRSGTENYVNGSEERHQKKVPTAEQLTTAIEACRGIKWSKSGYAVYFCVLAEDYGVALSRSKFEEKMQLLGFADCTAGTLANAFKNNTFLSSPTDMWPQQQGNHCGEAVTLAAAFRKALAEAMNG